MEAYIIWSIVEQRAWISSFLLLYYVFSFSSYTNGKSVWTGTPLTDNAEEPSVSYRVYARIKYSENLSQIQETSTEYMFTWPYFITAHFKAVVVMSVLSLSDSSTSIIYGGC